MEIKNSKYLLTMSECLNTLYKAEIDCSNLSDPVLILDSEFSETRQFSFLIYDCLVLDGAVIFKNVLTAISALELFHSSGVSNDLRLHENSNVLELFSCSFPVVNRLLMSVGIISCRD